MIKRVFLNPAVAPIFLPFILRLHNLITKLIARLSILSNNGVHPKHKILRYKEWFIAKISEDDVVLEVGSHLGAMSVVLAKKAKSVIAVEILEKLVEQAKIINSRENIEYITADVTQHDFSDYKINRIILSNVLEHIEKRIDFLKSLVSKLCADSSVEILIRVPLITRDWLPVFKKEMGIDYRLDPTHYIEYTEEELRKEIEAAGLSITSFEVRFGEAYLVCVKNG